MARQKGIIELEGTIGGLNFYYRKGKPVARKSGGGFNGKAIKTKASMVRVRENGSEFGKCMHVVKAFKTSLILILTQFKDGDLHHRLVSLFTTIKGLDVVSERGMRTVGNGLHTPAGLALLQHYVLTSGKYLEDVLGQSFSFDFETGLHLVGFDGSYMNMPSGSTHLKLMVGFLKFDFESCVYKFCIGNTVYLNKDSLGDFTIGPLELAVGDGKSIGVVFAQFVQELNGVYYPFKQVADVVLEIVYVG